MLKNKKRRTGLALLVTWLVTACGGQQTEPDVDADELHTLPGRFAEEPVTEPLVAREAYIGKDEFFLAYEGPDGLVYSGGNWSNRIDLTALLDVPDTDETAGLSQGDVDSVVDYSRGRLFVADQTDGGVEKVAQIRAAGGGAPESVVIVVDDGAGHEATFAV